MMQAFRNSAKVAGAIFALLMLIFMATSVDWGSLTRSTSAGKINGRTVDVRSYQQFVQQYFEEIRKTPPSGAKSKKAADGAKKGAGS